MRTTVISILAASTLAVGFAAAASAAGGTAVAVPSTIPGLPGLDGLDGLGVTPEQTQCLLENADGIDLNDLSSMLDLFTQCDFNPTDLLTVTPTDLDPVVASIAVTEASSSESVPSGGLDPVAVSAVLDALGLDAATLGCIDDGLSADVPDDEGPLGVLQGCGLSLGQLLAGAVGLSGEMAGAADIPTTEAGPPSDPTDTESELAIVMQIQRLLTDQGIELDDDQVGCLVDNLASLDLGDLNATLAVVESCDIGLTDLAS